MPPDDRQPPRPAPVRGWSRRIARSGATGRVRVAWRLVAFVAVLAAAVLLARWSRVALTGRARPEPSPTASSEPWFLLYRLTGVLAVALATWIALRAIERKGWADIGLCASWRALVETGWGALLAAGVMGTGFLALVVGGLVRVTGAALDGATLLALVLQFLPATLLVGIYEELIFRGYAFQLLCEGLGKWPATAAVALLFAAPHWSNPGMTGWTTAATAVWSVLLSILLLRTRSLWACIGFHWSGNVVQGFVLGFPASAQRFTASLLRLEFTGASWIAGGPGGLEAALPTLLAACAAAAWVLEISPWTPPPGARLLFERGARESEREAGR